MDADALAAPAPAAPAPFALRPLGGRGGLGRGRLGRRLRAALLARLAVAAGLAPFSRFALLARFALAPLATLAIGSTASRRPFAALAARSLGAAARATARLAPPAFPSRLGAPVGELRDQLGARQHPVAVDARLGGQRVQLSKVLGLQL